MSQRRLWIGTAILLLAAWLRLAGFEEALVGADQSSILANGAEVAALRDFPLVGIKSSVGVMQTAITPYLAAIPLMVVRKVVAIKWFFSVLDLLAVALLYRAMSRRFGWRAAGVTTLLYAANPWVVEFVRWIWYQSLVATFSTLAFSAFLLVVPPAPPRRQRWLVLGLVSATLMGMVHLAALPWAALLFVIGVVLAWRNRAGRGLALGILLSGLVAAPYLLFLVKSNFADLRLLSGAGAGTGEKALNWATYLLAHELLTGKEVLGTPRSPLWAESVVEHPALYAIAVVLLVPAALASVGRLLGKGDARAAVAFVLGWTILAPTLLLPTGVHLQHFYLLYLFPAPYALIGLWAGSWLRRPGRHPVLRITAGVAAASALVLALWWTHLWAVRIGYERQGQLRAPTRAWLMDRTVESVESYLAEGPENQVILLNDFEGDHLSPFDWVRNFVHSDRVRIVAKEQGFIIPPGPTCYVLGPGTSTEDLSPIAWRTVERPDLEVPAQPPWSFHCIPARDPLSAPLATWENGLSLLGVEVLNESGETFGPGATLLIKSTWHYRARFPKEYHFFNHLLKENELIAQVDGAGVPTWYWRNDDLLITYFRLTIPQELPAGSYHLRTGAYSWPDLERVPTLSGDDGYPIAVWIYP